DAGGTAFRNGAWGGTADGASGASGGGDHASGLHYSRSQGGEAVRQDVRGRVAVSDGAVRGIRSRACGTTATGTGRAHERIGRFKPAPVRTGGLGPNRPPTG